MCQAKIKFWIETMKKFTLVITSIHFFKLNLHGTEVEKNLHFPTIFLQNKLEYLKNESKLTCFKKFDRYILRCPPSP